MPVQRRSHLLAPSNILPQPVLLPTVDGLRDEADREPTVDEFSASWLALAFDFGREVGEGRVERA